VELQAVGRFFKLESRHPRPDAAICANNISRISVGYSQSRRLTWTEARKFIARWVGGVFIVWFAVIFLAFNVYALGSVSVIAATTLIWWWLRGTVVALRIVGAGLVLGGIHGLASIWEADGAPIGALQLEAIPLTVPLLAIGLTLGVVLIWRCGVERAPEHDS